ncbi:MAG: hypothetical protein WCA10_07555 [Terracidiphilus sp.]
MKKILVIAASMVCLVMGRPIAHAQDVGINGKWHFVLETPGGDREVDADLAVDADGNVTGKWGNADVAGIYKDGKLALEFQFTSEEVGATAPMKIDGKLDDTAALTGDWAFSEYNGTYKAMRPGTPAPDSAPVAAPAADAAPAPTPAPDAKPSSPDPKPDPQ